jgi:adenosylcobinamide-GDP ribazoletransferase
MITVSIAFGLTKLAKTKIGGQTGDVLGATQILCETAILVFLVA